MNRCFVTTIVAAITMTLASFSMADVVDGDFEATGASAGWTYGVFPNNADQDAAAPGIDSAVEGNETLLIGGNFLGGATVSFSEAFQDLAIDGTKYSIGDEIFVTGILGHQSSNPLQSSNNAYFEIGFLSSFGEFASASSGGITESSAKDVYHVISTALTAIPAGASTLRVKVIYRQQGNATGVAWADNISLVNLTTIPEPGTVSVLALGLCGLAFRRRRCC